ncbi:hypothetical protein BJX61DRAFT_459258 [Aspergillus egyptiacus]|nr:hypothetical protein BJX61DRAFT_459258 [Aspergillus egyptiacus]
MDVDSSRSRDPRLSNRGPRPPLTSRPSLPTRLSQHEAPQRQSLAPLPQSAGEVQNETSGDFLVRGITDLVQAAVFAASSKTEREKLQKKRSSTEELLRKARSHGGFPSTVEFFQNARKDEDQVLASIDKKIKDYEANYKRLEADLRTKYAAHAESQTPRLEDKTPQLQEDIKLANDKLSGLQRNIASLTERDRERDTELQAFKQEMTTFRDTLSSQRQGFANYTNSLSLVTNDLSETSSRLKRLEAKAEEPKQGLASETPETKKALGDLSLQYKALEGKMAGWTQKLDLVSSSFQSISTLPGQVDQRLKDQQRKVDQLVSSRGVSTKLDDAILTVNAKLEELSNIQSTKDDLQFAELEEIRTALSKTNKDIEILSGQVKNLPQSDGKFEPKFAALGAEINMLIQRMDTVNVALLSLETRYNNLTTDALAHQMVGAMNEMYPSVDQMARAVTTELPSLKRKVDQMEANVMSSLAARDGFAHAIESIHGNLKALRDSYENLEKRCSGLSGEDLSQMKLHLDNLEDKHKSLASELASKVSADRTFLQEIERERESLQSRLVSLSKAHNQLCAENARTRSEAVNEDDMRALEFRITAMEKSTIQSYEKLKGQIDSIKKTVHLPGPPSQRDSTLEGHPSLPQKPVEVDPLGIRIKRAHPSSYSDDERSIDQRSNSPASPDSIASQTVGPGEMRKKKKKKKKRRLEGEPSIQLDD